MNDKWVEIIVSIGLAIGALLSAGLMLAGCAALVLTAWKLL